MLLMLSLIIVFGLVILAAMTTGIVGLVKKRKNLVIVAATLFAVGALGCVISGFIYAKKVYEYVKGGDFQADARRGSALVGETVGSVSSGLSEGLSSTLDDEAVAKLAGKSATIVGRSIKTVHSGIDSIIGNKNIFVDQSLAGAGLELGRADEEYKSAKTDLGIFIGYKKDFTGTLRLTNYDQTGKKIEIVEKKIDAKAGKEGVEVFSFSHSDPGLTTYYILSKAD